MGSSCNKYRSTVSSFEPSIDGDKKCGITEPSFQALDKKEVSNEIQSDNNKIGNTGDDFGINEKHGKDHEKGNQAPELAVNAGKDGTDVQSGKEGVGETNTLLETESAKSQDVSEREISQDTAVNSSETLHTDQQINTADIGQVESGYLLKPTELPDSNSNSPGVEVEADLDSGMEYDEDDELPTDNDQKKSGDTNAHHGTGTSHKMSGIGELGITKPAPDFEASAVVNGEFKTIKLSDYKGKYVVLFFYPLDFTFVCPTEIIAFSEKAEEFRAIDCEVLGCSTDSVYSHLAWVNTPRKMGGLGPMNVPLIGDKTLEIARKYGCLKEDEGVAFRGLYIIDDKGNLRQITINDLPVGRSVDETLRLVQAFQFTDKHGEVCPAGWKPGKDTMKPDPNASKEYFGKTH